MANVSEVIARLESIRKERGDVEVRIVNYHSDFQNDRIENIDKAIRFDDKGFIVIGGETY